MSQWGSSFGNTYCLVDKIKIKVYANQENSLSDIKHRLNVHFFFNNEFES